MMRYIFLVLLGMMGFSYAQIPQGISFQGIARDEQGNCLTDSSINIDISILNSATGTTGVYTEGHDNTQTDAQGVYALTIGQGSPQFGTFSDIDWSTPKWVKLDINGASVATVELMSVPFAFQADNSLSSDSSAFAFKSLRSDSSIKASNGKYLNPATLNETLAIKDSTQDIKILLRAGNPTTDGNAILYGANGSENVYIGPFGTPNQGAIILRDSSNRAIGQYRGGFWILRSPNSYNVTAGAVNGGSADFGRIAVYNNSSSNQWVVQAFSDPNNNGTGRIEAGGANGGVKSFVMPHPNRTGKEIVYACIEGPEAGAYVRGTAKLINGEAEVVFPDHFQLVANPQTLTIMTSPWSAESNGLAIIERTSKGFKVKELSEGKGTYSFDWEAKAVRKGHENFEVIRDKQSE